MSVLIKEISMPSGEDEGVLIAIYDGKAYCIGTKEEHEAIEVPAPHGDLIDRDKAYSRMGKLAEDLEEKVGYERSAPYAMAAMFLNNTEEFPTIIEAEEVTK